MRAEGPTPSASKQFLLRPEAASAFGNLHSGPNLAWGLGFTHTRAFINVSRTTSDGFCLVGLAPVTPVTSTSFLCDSRTSGTLKFQKNQSLSEQVIIVTQRFICSSLFNLVFLLYHRHWEQDALSTFGE